MKEFKVASLFAGIGGICLGFQNAKFEDYKYELVWANEIDEYACVTYRNNFKHKLFEGDINKILDQDLCSNEIERQYYSNIKDEILSTEVDILNGGFPCQAFSIAGEQKGFKDERGILFLSIIRLVKEIGRKNKMPRVILLENVKNLKSHDHGNTYKIIKNEIEKLGYTVTEEVLNTMNYSNLPQNRERIYIVCFRDKEDSAFFSFDKIKKENKKANSKVEREQQIKNIINIEKKQDFKYYYTKEKYPHYFKDEYNKAEQINLSRQINETYQFYQVRRGMYVRKNQSNVCPTLTANMGTGGHNVPLILDNYGIRKLVPAETFMLQGFPVNSGYKLPTEYKGKKYSDAKLYKQAGNAVSVPVIQLIATEILKALKKRDSET